MKYRRTIGIYVLLLGIMFCLAGGGARAGGEVSVVETFPQGYALEMGLKEQFHLRLKYQADQPSRIWARPFFQGEQVSASSNPSPLYSGEGYARGWFSLDEPGQVDEVHITLAPGGSRKEAVSIIYPVRLTVTKSGPLNPTAVPAWVHDTRQNEDALYKQQERTYDDSILGNGFVFLVSLAVLTFVGAGFVLPVVAFRRWTGAWRIAAAVPLAVLGLVLFNIIVGVALDPTSHNLWPLELVMFGLGSFAGITVLVIVRRMLGIRG